MRHLRRARAFTLIELLVVIVILGILMAVAVPTFLRQQSKAQDSRTQQYLTTAFKAIRASTPDTGNLYPTSTSMVSWITQSEPELVAQRGSCTAGVQSAPQDAVLVDPASNANALTLCARSQSGNVWKLTATATSAPTLLNGTLIPLTFNGNEITDTTRAASTQGDGLSADSSTGIWLSTTNLAFNGGAETNTSPAWTANGLGTVSRDNSVSKFGSWSWRYDAPGTNGTFAAGIGETTALGQNGAAGTSYTISTWAQGGSGKSFELLERQYYTDSTSQDFTSSCFAGPSSWTRYSTTGVVPAGKTLDKIDFQLRPCGLLNDLTFGVWTMWLDGIQIEKQLYPTPYVETSGSTVARAGGRVQAPASILSANQGWVALRVRLNWAATTRTDFPALFQWITDSNNRIGVLYNGPSGNWAMDSRTSSTPSDAASAVQAFPAGGVITVIGTWSTTTLGMSVNGSTFNTIPNGHFLTPTSSTSDIGSGAGGSQCDCDVLWFAAGTGTLSNADAATINGFGSTDPKLSQFPSGAQTTMVWGGTGTSGSLK